MILPVNSIVRKLLATMLLVVAALVLVLGGIEIVHEYERYRHEVDALWGKQVDARKKQLEAQVAEAISYIDFKKTQIRARVQGSLESRVLDAHGVVSHLYEISKGSHSKQELRTLVRETLRSQRFNNGRGYFFIFGTDGSVLLHAARPELEQKNLLDKQDAEGTFVVREMIDLARSKGEGFISYRWPRPGSPPEQEFEKIAFIKYLPQLDCFIGAGEYLEDTEADVKAEVLERIERFRFGGNDYVFVGQWDGLALTYPTKGKNMLAVTDSNGVKIVEEAIALARKGGGFFQYVMPKLGDERNSLKLSYVRGVKDWQWYVGAGVYLDDLEAASAGARRELQHEIALIVGLDLLLMVATFVFGMLVVRKTAGRIQQAFSAFELFFAKAAQEKVEMEISALHFAEFRFLAESANRMLVEQQALEDGLRKSEKKYRALIETTGTGFVKIDVEGRVLDANQEYVRMTGHADLSEIIGRPVAEWTAEHDLARNGEAVKECASLGFIRHLQIDYVNGEGNFIPVEINATVVQGDEKPEILSICNDISVRKQLEGQLRQAQKMEALGTLAGGIAHDFNNILAVIIGYAEMAKRSLPQEADSVRTDIQEVLRASLRARDLVKQILAFSRKSGEERNTISVGPIVKEAIKFLRASIPASIEIREDVDPDCGAVLANITDIHRIVVNLCTNAFHAMEAAGGVLTVVLKNVTQGPGEQAGESGLVPGHYVLLSVR